MKTRQNLTFISYNSRTFLESRLNELVSSGKISLYLFIFHFHEGIDELGREEKEDHWHVYIRNNSTIDTVWLHDFFEEMIIGSDQTQSIFINKIGCPDNVFNDMFLYFLHHKTYLDSKGLSRKYHYGFDDVISCDIENVFRLSNENPMPVDMRDLQMINEVHKNPHVPLSKLCIKYAVPLRYHKYYIDSLRSIISEDAALLNEVNSVPLLPGSDDPVIRRGKNLHEFDDKIIMCSECGSLLPDTEFSWYQNGVGVCKSCIKNS